MRDIDRAVELLKPLFNGLAEGRNVDVFAVPDAVRGDLIIVRIDNAQYEINVTAENVRSMVKSVIDRVALKL